MNIWTKKSAQDLKVGDIIRFRAGKDGDGFKAGDPLPPESFMSYTLNDEGHRAIRTQPRFHDTPGIALRETYLPPDTMVEVLVKDPQAALDEIPKKKKKTPLDRNRKALARQLAYHLANLEKVGADTRREGTLRDDQGEVIGTCKGMCYLLDILLSNETVAPCWVRSTQITKDISRLTTIDFR